MEESKVLLHTNGTTPHELALFTSLFPDYAGTIKSWRKAKHYKNGIIIKFTDRSELLFYTTREDGKLHWHLTTEV